ncbi:hypothetical protein BDZ97DRAFT_1641166, partial [Flammula alnicola]
MKAFISTVLGFDAKKPNFEGGILGMVKAHYGCVEAQGRGTLHCHMIVWVEGALNVDEIKRKALERDVDFQTRLIRFLDDTISNEIPVDPGDVPDLPSSIHHPCSVRGLNGSHAEDVEKAVDRDFHNLVKKCQSHKHTSTCFKYWKGPPNPKECRFDLDESNVRKCSFFDPETGELHLRCLDGMVNNFNKTILQCIRCNMDIKFIGSGASAKAVLYYITDYITKSQLKSHVAYAALELAVRKLDILEAEDDPITIRAKKLLQKCAFSMISRQELSAPQVCSYLMDFEDHFTSHEFHSIFWPMFENYVDGVLP